MLLQNDGLVPQAIAEMLEGLEGVRSVELEVLEFTRFLEVFNGQADRADLFAWRPASTPTLDAAVQLQRTTTTFPVHNLGYSDPAYDATFAELQAADPGSPERQEIACDMAEQMREEAPWLYVMQLPDTWAHAPEVTGFEVDARGDPLLTQLGLGG